MAPRGPTSAFESEYFGKDASFRLEQPVGSMTISPSGRDVALASKEGLHIIDLDSPWDPPRYLPHRTPWEVADVQWSPFAARDYWVISTSNQKALVWNLDARSWQDPIEFVLHGHTRAITDINFSAHHPDVLATCAVDSFVHSWDLRAPARPVNSFSDWFAGATQVKWNRQDEHVIASSHDKFLHIWDDRNGAYPVRTIEAHGTKIYGIDWNRHHPNKIVTCSLDRTIKFWDFDGEESTLERVIETPFPVWRARHTPFGWGLLAMPQRGNSDLHLYDRRAINGVFESGPVRPVATFGGHEGQVKEFLWRARGTIVDNIDNRDFQLVSWGTDRELRLHAVDPDIYADIGYEKGVSKMQRLNFTRRGAVYKTFRDVPGDADSPSDDTPRSEVFPRHSHLTHFRPRSSTSVGMSKMPVSQFRGWVQGGRYTQRSGMHGRGNNRQNTDPISWLKNVKIFSWDPDTLAEEIRQVGEKFKKVEFEVVDISHRKAVMSVPWGEDSSKIYLRVEMKFPKLYPRSANAILTLQKSGSLDEETHRLITTELHTIAETYASRKRGCLEAVLRYLLREQNLEQIVAWVLGESLVDSKILDTSTVGADDSSSDSDDQLDGVREGLDASANILVPLAKGCGALWSETGKLVCFFPAKGNEPVSFLSTLGVKDLEDSESGRLFEGFGRLHASSPARKPTRGAKTADDDSDSDTSDSSWKSSSSSSSSFETEQNIPGVSSYRAGASGLQQRSRSPDRSNHSTTGGPNKLNDAPRKSAVSIHTFDDLIPSKRELAVGYQLFGDGPDVCKHNATVARNASLRDLESVWIVVGLVLDNSVPLEVLPELRDPTLQDVLVIAKTVTGRTPGKSNNHLDKHNVFGRTRWGSHPFGSTYLLPAIFDYFERLGDVQMLATLACVLASSINNGVIPGDDQEQMPKLVSSDVSHTQSEYFPSRAVAKSSFQKDVEVEGYVFIHSKNVPLGPGVQGLGGAESRRRPHHLLGRQGSQFSSRAASFVADDSHDPSAPYSTAVSVSTSPEGNRPSNKTTSGISYSSARASLSALTQSYSNSPPNQSSSSGFASSLKKYSPSGSLAPGWVSSGIFGSQMTSRGSRMTFHHTEGAGQDSRELGNRSSLSSSGAQSSRRSNTMQTSASRRSGVSVVESEVSEKTFGKTPPKRRKIKTRLINQDKFDLDGYSSSSILDRVLERKCRMYRESYANLLDVWQLHLQRAEVLKFDGMTAEGSDLGHGRTNGIHPPPGNGLERPRRKTLTTASRATDLGLEIRRLCRNCGELPAPIEKNGVPIGWHCVSPSCIPPYQLSGVRAPKAPKRSACAICNTSISGLAVPCLQCGHMTCYDCAQGWFGARQAKHDQAESRRSSAEKSQLSPIEGEDGADALGEEPPDEHDACPTGCGCPCATLATVTVPFPQSNNEDATASNHEHAYLEPPQLTHQLSRSSGGSSNLPRSTSLLVPTSSHSHSSTDAGTGGADTALAAAFLALTQSHQRSKSVNLVSARSKASSVSRHSETQNPGGSSKTPNESGKSTVSDSDGEPAAASQLGEGDDSNSLNPFAGSKIATLGRGIGAGLSRGLTSKASDATIRKIK
ncbi:WD domain-containing protein [Cladophialophora immunda]|nr:WD domain-containing protein [Cladophialophora immunda]